MSAVRSAVTVLGQPPREAVIKELITSAPFQHSGLNEDVLHVDVLLRVDIRRRLLKAINGYFLVETRLTVQRSLASYEHNDKVLFAPREPALALFYLLLINQEALDPHWRARGLNAKLKVWFASDGETVPLRQARPPLAVMSHELLRLCRLFYSLTVHARTFAPAPDSSNLSL
uniref:Uncharacterized protein n=1 Tax=Timema bartmani TaxID=61472 RepID=A0A7R9EUT7_9NEOP|nr:unnamed protein product [Timema bartmani]